MKNFFLKPGDGRQIRDPVTKQWLSPQGEEKPRNQFWLRAVRSGDAVEVSPTETAVAVEPRRGRSKD